MEDLYFVQRARRTAEGCFLRMVPPSHSQIIYLSFALRSKWILPRPTSVPRDRSRGQLASRPTSLSLSRLCERGWPAPCDKSAKQRKRAKKTTIIYRKMDEPLDALVGRSRGGKAQGQVRGGRARTTGVKAGGRDTPYMNTAGTVHKAGASLQEIAAAGDSERVLKIGASTSAKTVAGSIAHVTREGGAPMLLPLGASCINQAVKGIAIARRYLNDEGLDLTCQPDFRDNNKNSVVLKLTAFSYVPQTDPTNEVILTVASGSNPATVAGAIAAKVREEQPVATSSIGADSVAKAIYAIAFARLYLGGDGLDICCLPEFVKEQSSTGEEVSVMKIAVAIAE